MLDRLMGLRGKFIEIEMKDRTIISGILEISPQMEPQINGQKIPMAMIKDVRLKNRGSSNPK